MEKDFFDLYENQPVLALEVGHNSIADWCLVIYDIKGTTLCETTKPIINIQGSDRRLVFSRAYAELCEYLSKERGGY